MKPLAYSYLRFSTADQVHGDSLRRQTALMREWCERKGIQIAEDYRDLGVSAFRGANAASGALRAFLQKVEAGQIPRGSYLIVESLDRLSRTAITDALQMFLGLINAGIIVVTLADDKTYDRERINDGNFTDLIISLTILSRANEESRMKSKRIAAAWAKKRADLATVKMTRKCPGWLRLSDDRKRFEIVSERGKVVKQIFEWVEAGRGCNSIAKELNRTNTPIFGRAAQGWSATYVRKILENRATIGEFTPHVRRDGRIQPLDPVEGYYPAVISKALFASVSRIRAARPDYRGRSNSSNVFSKLLFDRQSGARVIYVKTGPRHYLVNALSLTGLAPRHSWRYEQFLALFLTLVKRASQQKASTSPPPSDLDRAKLELEDVAGQIDRLLDVLSRGFSASAEERLHRLERKKAELEAKIRELELQRSARAVDLREIDWDDAARLRENLRATVKRIDMDCEKRWFRAEMLDGIAYTVQVNGPETVIEIEGHARDSAAKRRSAAPLTIPTPPARKPYPKRPVDSDSSWETLSSAVRAVLRQARKPLTIDEIMERLAARGRATTSRGELASGLYGMVGVRRVGCGVFAYNGR